MLYVRYSVMKVYELWFRGVRMLVDSSNSGSLLVGFG